MKHSDCDFIGWGTRNGILCSDGRTILKDAFKDCDGLSVPLVWNHKHDSSDNVLGHALLENRPEGVRVYGYFNNTERGQNAKEQVDHGDITNLSIYANELKHINGSFVSHGTIREVSLVLAGANPGATIDYVLAHSDDSEDEAYIYTDEEISLCHSDQNEGEKMDEEKKVDEQTEKKADTKKTAKDVFDSMNEEQKNLLYAMVGAALDESGDNNSDEDDSDEEKGEKKEMKHNVFENESNSVLMHQAREEFEQAVIKDAKSFGSMKESFLAHSEEFKDYLAHAIDTTGMDTEGTINRVDGSGNPYGIGNIDFLFPEPKNLNTEPEFLKRQTEWVSKVMSGVKHSPFSRIKSTFADITEDEARAKGYITGKMKKEEVFSLLKRSTSPTTVYKKQRLDRDDVIDITDFNVVNYLKREMRMMLDEELAGAFLFGDGRLASSDDKINPQNIRPIAFEMPLFNVKVESDIDVSQLGEDDVASETAAKAFVKALIRNRKKYRGTGTPTLFIGENLLTEILLLQDGFGHYLYKSTSELATILRVKEIVPVALMDERNIADENGRKLIGLVVNLNDYQVGADKGGEVNMFDDFDIDYNQMKYLIETRCSGALVKPFSAISVFAAAANSEDDDQH